MSRERAGATQKGVAGGPFWVIILLPIVVLATKGVSPVTTRVLLTLAVLGIVGILVGCDTQNEVIGQGPATLVFRNGGAETIEVQVGWDDADGETHHRHFDVQADGRVELHLVDRLTYEIRLDADSASATTAGGAPPADQVIVVGGAE